MNEKLNLDRKPTPSDLIEVWKDIDGYKGYYQISSLGNIRSIDRKVANYDINTGNIGKKTVFGNLKPSHVAKTGYKMVSLYKENSKKGYLVHRLVAKAFIRNRLNKPMVNHKNGVKTDNRVENLEWCTLSENMKHSYRSLNQKPPKTAFVEGYDHVGSMPILMMKDEKIVCVFSHSTQAVEHIYSGKSLQAGRTCISRNCRNGKPYYGYGLSYISKNEYSDLVTLFPPQKIKLVRYV